jgi:hypothetical protein
MAQTKSLLMPEDIVGDQLYGVLLKADGERKSYPDSEILRKIRAAEDFYEGNLNIHLGIKKCISAAKERNITIDPATEIEEPGYDYDPRWWLGDQWGNIKTRHRPIVPDPNSPSGITRFAFGFPTAEPALFVVPQIWIKPDFKYGQLNIVPSTAAVFASFNPWLMSVAAGGAFGIPKVVQIDYFAGYDPALLRQNHADLLEGIKLRTLLLLGGVISNILAAGIQSQSISLDGLSHSRGFGSGKYGIYSGVIENAIRNEEEIRESFRNHEKGIIVSFM